MQTDLNPKKLFLGRRMPIWRAAGLIVLALAWATPAHADAGVPVLAAVWPWFWLLLIPIVLIEARIAERECALDRKRAFAAALSANLATAVVGVPFASIAMFVVALVWTYTCGSLVNLGDAGNQLLMAVLCCPWLPPYAGHGVWPVYVAAGVLLVPTFFVSVFVEERVMRRWVPGNRVATQRWAWRAHLVTYSGMLVIVLGGVLVALRALSNLH
jgi:hypothetical protein